MLFAPLFYLLLWPLVKNIPTIGCGGCSNFCHIYFAGLLFFMGLAAAKDSQDFLEVH